MAEHHAIRVAEFAELRDGGHALLGGEVDIDAKAIHADVRTGVD